MLSAEYADNEIPNASKGVRIPAQTTRESVGASCAPPAIFGPNPGHKHFEQYILLLMKGNARS